MNRFLVWSFSAVFALALVLPALFVNTDPNAALTLDNRMPAPAPVLLLDDKSFNSDFAPELESYLSDRAGLRTQAVEAKIFLLYKFFNYLSVTNHFQGTDNHLYFVEDIGFSRFQMLEPVSEDVLALHTSQFLTFDTYLNSKGIPLVIITIPDKESVYPEFFGPGVVQASPETPLDSLVLYAQENTDLDIHNLKYPLLDAKDSADGELLYYKNFDDAHWNQKGALVGYIESMALFKKYLPSIHKMTEEDFVLEGRIQRGAPVILSGDEFLMNNMRYEDVIYTRQPEGGYTGKWDAEASHPYYGNRLYQRYTNASIPDAPRLLILGDSYTYDFLLSDYAESFSEVVIMPCASEASLVIEEIEKVQPDIVLYQAVERAFDTSSLAGFQNFME